MSVEKPLKISILKREETPDYQVLRLEIALVRNLIENNSSKEIPITLDWPGEETYHLNMGASGVIELPISLPLVAPDYKELLVQATLEDGQVIKEQITIPPIDEIQENFHDLLANGGKIDKGQRVLVVAGKYDVECMIRVSPHATLIIEPGVHLFFYPGFGIHCAGGLIAKGTKKEPIYLRSKFDDKVWGGVMLNGPYVRRSDFQFCYIAEGEGSPVRLEGNGLLRYDANSKMKRGGGLLIANVGKEKEDAVKISNSIFQNNRADKGGGLALYNSGVDLKNVHFEECEATGSGGGLHVENGFVSVQNKLTFDRNHADVLGGGIAMTHNSVYSGETPVFKDNTANEMGNDAFILRSEEVEAGKWKGDVFVSPL